MKQIIRPGKGPDLNKKRKEFKSKISSEMKDKLEKLMKISNKRAAVEILQEWMEKDKSRDPRLNKIFRQIDRKK